ncbi:MAG: RNA polymerase sigma factor [Candidatus Helarchaeota archaeon]
MEKIEEKDCLNKKDVELVKLSLENSDYFLCIVKKYEDPLMRYIRRITNINFEDAEDLLQEVFIKVYTNLNAFDPKLKFSSWIYRIAHNKVISNFRKLKIRPEKINSEINKDILEKIKSDLNIEKEFDQKILKDKLIQVINQLDIKYKEVIVLKYLEEKTYDEISDIIKKPINTVGTLINRAKKKLNNIIKNENIHPVKYF